MSQLDYAAIRKQISIRRVLRLLDWEPARQRGHQWRGVCPLCCTQAHSKELQRPFSVHISRDLFRCFRCHSSGNQLDLWAVATGLPLFSATLNLCHRLHIPPTRIKNLQPRNTP